MKHADLAEMQPIDVVNALNTGVQLVDASIPFVKDIFGKIAELIKGLQGDELSTPHGKRVHIEALEARNIAQKELNKLYDSNFAILAGKGLLG